VDEVASKLEVKMVENLYANVIKDKKTLCHLLRFEIFNTGDSRRV
jgi:hypothetical protein